MDVHISVNGLKVKKMERDTILISKVINSKAFGAMAKESNGSIKKTKDKIDQNQQVNSVELHLILALQHKIG